MPSVPLIVNRNHLIMSLLDTIKSIFGKPKSEEPKTGKVVFFNSSKGYGFIQSDQLEDKIFVHVVDSECYLRKGITVKFDVGKDKKGLRAINVRNK